ncbi:unnamed protein product [Phytomonas sp. EM1]|nr:unnamed protein product [Phytomonas sp. EM1]|eukprot:CCW61947.1 unnamed protein product [Phytomonas sp. isolate EM1]
MTADTLPTSIPIYLQRFEPSSLPKHRERTLTGRSNRQRFEAERIRELERLFIKSRAATSDAKGSRRGHPLSVGEVLCRSEYGTVGLPSMAAPLRCSMTKGTTKVPDLPTQRPSQVVIPGEAPDANGGSVVPKVVNKEEPMVGPKDVTESQSPGGLPQRQREERGSAVGRFNPVHPAVVTLLSDNKRGKGHTKTAESCLMSALQPLPPRPTLKGVINRPNCDGGATVGVSSSGNNALRTPADAATRGGGQLEYDDPLVNPYCRNALVARHHQRGRLQLREGGVSSTPLGEAPLTSTTLKLQRELRAREAAWIASYMPSLRPYDVQPCLGRVGCTDYHPTFDRVQADPSSTLYADADARFRTIQEYPLDTPNFWQLQQRKERRQKVLRLPDS